MKEDYDNFNDIWIEKWEFSSLFSFKNFFQYITMFIIFQNAYITLSHIYFVNIPPNKNNRHQNVLSNKIKQDNIILGLSTQDC